MWKFELSPSPLDFGLELWQWSPWYQPANGAPGNWTPPHSSIILLTPVYTSYINHSNDELKPGTANHWRSMSVMASMLGCSMWTLMQSSSGISKNLGLLSAPDNNMGKKSQGVPFPFHPSLCRNWVMLAAAGSPVIRDWWNRIAHWEIAGGGQREHLILTLVNCHCFLNI